MTGHGGRSRDRTGEEVDGFNETLLPVDHSFSGTIVDNDVNKMLVNRLPKGVMLHCIIDACHSGTVMDLPFLSKGVDAQQRWIWEDQRRRTYKGTAGGEVICFSGCDDSQTSADTSSLAQDSANTGALTFSFINAIESTIGAGKPCTYASILHSIRGTLGQATGAAGGPTRGTEWAGWEGGGVMTSLARVVEEELIAWHCVGPQPLHPDLHVLFCWPT